jgi:ABC-2 type transport system ATP-binding protein
MSAEPAIAVQGLGKRFDGKTVVDGIDLTVGKGQVYGFLGPNGSGKTTTIRMLCGLLTPDEGAGRCLGFDLLTEAAEIRRHVGYMTQKFGLYEDLSIAENLDFVARVYGVPSRHQAVEGALERLGLVARRRQLAGTLSGGWKQRLALAACLIHDPELLLLDEPTAGVDPKARRDFWDEIHKLAADGVTVLVSTHYMDEAERCEAIAYISAGRLIADGPVDQVVRASGLHTWIVEGERLRALEDELQGRSGIEQIAVFGARLHVSGTDEAALERAIGPFRDDTRRRWTPADPSLEDVFIHLMAERGSPAP